MVYNGEKAAEGTVVYTCGEGMKTWLEGCGIDAEGPAVGPWTREEGNNGFGFTKDNEPDAVV